MRRVLGWIVAGLLALVAMLAIAVVALDTGAGHSLATRLIAGLRPANGLTYSVARIDGSLYGQMTLRGIVVRDAAGVVAETPAATIAWHPGALIHNRVAADLIGIDRATVLRRPLLKPTPPSPLLPDIDIVVRRLVVRALVLDPAVTGKRQVVGIAGDADIASGRARINLAVNAVTGGDRLMLTLDAVPAEDRLIVAAHVAGPVGGVIDGLAKLGKPIALDLGGSGSWKAWHGTVVASLGNDRLADLALMAANGRFSATGTVRPALVAPAAGPVGVLAVDAMATASQRIVDTIVTLRSPALSVTAKGKFDLGAGRYDDLRVDAGVARPSALNANLSGRDLRAALVVDGPFATPTIDYRVAAAALGSGTMLAEQVQASGIATVDATLVRLPLHATARRVTGVGAASGGLLDNVRIDGDIRVTATQIVSDNLRLRSNQIDATVVAALTLATGDFTAAFKGRVNRYVLAGIGVVDLVTDARLVPTGKGQFRLRGNVRVATVRIDNASVRDFLGGQAVATAVVDRAPDGLISLSALRLTAPKFRIVDGQGSYRPDGRIAFAASGSQAGYGPLAVTVSGTIVKPVVTLRAKRPNVGVQFNDVEAVLRPVAGGYAITARGGSPYGPFAADIGLVTGPGPLKATVRRASFAGLVATGTIAATPAGPFTGRLAITGPGLDGSLTLSAAGKVQRIDAALRADHARILLPEPLLIGRGTATATAILIPGAPQISGTGSFADVRRGNLLVAHANGNGVYSSGRGTLAVTADGTSCVPFTVTADAALTPNVIRVNGHGTIDGIALRLAAPAEIDHIGGGYRLLPATIQLPRGAIVVAGASGATTTISAQLQAVDLALVEAFSPGLGLGGKVSGEIGGTLPGGNSFPTGHANLTVAGFSRAGVTSASVPADIAIGATLSSTGGAANAVLRRGGAVVGRLQARLTPIPGTTAQPWTERLIAAPLGGGVRYNGPAELLWALSGISGQQLSGPLAIGADFSGHLGAPQIRGVARAKGLRYENTAFGTVVDRIDLDSRFVDTRVEVVSLAGRAGDGSVSVTGYADLAADKGFPIDLRVAIKRARLAASKALDATVSGALTITNGPAAKPLIAGDLVIDRARYAVLRPAAAEVTELDGVRRKNAPLIAAIAPAGPPSNFQLAINLRADSQLFVSGLGLEAEWRAALKINGTADTPVVVGPITLVRGTYGFGGRNFALSRGIVRFAGEVPYNPALDIEATTSIEGLTAIIDITGRAFAPEITFTSTPALAQDEVLSRLLFGGSIESLTPTQALQLAASLNTLRGSSGGGFNPLGTLRKATGIDRLRLLGSDKATGAGPSLAAGKYISNRIYVEVTTDARGYTSTQLEIALSRTLRLLSAVSSFGNSNVGLRYSRDY